MNESVLHLKRLNIKKGKWKKGNIKNFKNSMDLKFLIALVVIYFEVHLRNSQKEWMK